MAELIITADDFGIGVETSRGIVEAAAAGVLSRTSVMVVTGEHLDRSLTLLDRVPGLELGLHLTLCSPAGHPLVATRSSGLLNRDGRFRSVRSLLLLGHIDPSAVRDEILAQSDRFTRLLGRPPAHVDGHQHAHQLPGIVEVVAELVREGRLPKAVRCTTPPAGVGPSAVAYSALGIRQRTIHRLGRQARPLLVEAGAVLTDGFLGVVRVSNKLPEPSGLSPWAGELASIQGRAGRFELMVHPGHDDPTLRGRDPYRRQRPIELAWLLAGCVTRTSASTRPTGTS